jgi:hypothetical protein
MSEGCLSTELVMITPVDNYAFSDDELNNVKLVSDISETLDIKAY